MSYYFGFCSQKTLKLNEIATLVNVHPSYISKTIKKQLKAIYNYLNEQKKVKAKTNHLDNTKIDFLYIYLNCYSKEEINKALSQLNYEDFKILSRYIENPNYNNSITFFQSLIPKIKSLISTTHMNKEKDINDFSLKEENDSHLSSIEDSHNDKVNNNQKDTSYEEDVCSLTVLDDNSFLSKIVEHYLYHSDSVTLKEFFILTMMFINISNHSYSLDELASFLNISLEEVNSIMIQALNNIKNYYSKKIESASSFTYKLS